MNVVHLFVAVTMALQLGPIEKARELRREARDRKAQQDFRGCAKFFAEASLHETNFIQNDHYNTACCLALAGDKAGALERLRLSVEHGYRDPDHILKDEDLVTLHADKGFRRTVDLARTKRDTYLRSVNRDLVRLFEEDQAGRRRQPPVIDPEADTRRRREVDEILRKGGAKVSEDYFHAAMVYQHGESVVDARRAHDLAMKAVALDGKNRRALWLAAASKDRELIREGKPQRYGTQFDCGSGACKLFPVDASVTDQERARWDVPPLAEARRRAASLTPGGPPGPAPAPAPPRLFTPAAP